MFEHIPTYAGDPILSLMDAYQKDPRPHKVNLSIGLYYDEQQQVPQLNAIQQTYTALDDQLKHVKLYLPMSGLSSFNHAMQTLIFATNAQTKLSRIATVQSLGGSGALKLAADFMHQFFPKSQLWVSDPTWENHISIFTASGVNCNRYPYYDAKCKGVDFTAMLTCLETLAPQSMVLLHPCCHNPTGADLTQTQWDQVIKVLKTRQLIALFDMAYQGFSQGLQQDNYAITQALHADLTFMVSHSCSKIFSLYGERVGSLSIVCPDADTRVRVEGQLKSLVRKIYSSPPTTGAVLVSHVLNTPHLNILWQQQLQQMRLRMQKMRQALRDQLEQALQQDFSYLTTQQGMFSYTGLSPAQVQQLRDDYAIYVVGSGRLCIAGLNHKNLTYVAQSLSQVLKQSAIIST
jgi:aromatic-amino-acid transaminase